MIELIVGFAIAIVLLAVEYLLCTRLENPFWGGIVPMMVLAGTIALFASGRVLPEERVLISFIIINVVCFLDWASGREKYKKRKHAELERMKAKDIQ